MAVINVNLNQERLSLLNHLSKVKKVYVTWCSRLYISCRHQCCPSLSMLSVMLAASRATWSGCPLWSVHISECIHTDFDTARIARHFIVIKILMLQWRCVDILGSRRQHINSTPLGPRWLVAWLKTKTYLLISVWCFFSQTSLRNL